MSERMIVIPAADVEPRTNSNEPFPAGPWIGTIDVVRSKTLPSTDTGAPFKGYTSTEGEILALQLGANEGVDGQESVGNRKYFADLVIADGEFNLTNIDVSDRDHPAWQLQNGARNIMRLGIALGAAQMTGDNGSSRWELNENFVDQLRAGEFDGMRVGFEVRHTLSKKKYQNPVTGKMEARTFENLGGFFPAE